MADLFLVVDAGGSQTKVIFQTPTDDKPQFFLMPPDVEPISQVQFDRYQERIGWLGSPSPQQQAWFTVTDQLWVVGAFAAEFDPQDRLREKKYENALYKVLAAVGVVVQKLGMSRRKIALHLSLLLPWQEFNDRQAFETQLRSLLTGFAFRGQALKVSLKSFLCRPEGGGLAATRMRQQGLEWFQERRLVVLLFGHRNTSALYFEYGQFKQGDSPLYGFSQFMALLTARYSVLDEKALLLALVKAMQTHREAYEQQVRTYESATWGRNRYSRDIDYPNWQRARALDELVTVRDETLRSSEQEALGEAVEAALDEYWEKLEAWLLKVVPTELDEVIVSGGAALLLEPKLRQFFDDTRGKRPLDGDDVVWDAELKETMEKAFSWRFSDNGYGTARFADAYGLFDQMLSAAGEK